MTVNKFNIHWQLTRVKAKEIKDPHKKISFVLGFLKKHPSSENHGRVLNWMRMTGLGYKGDVRDTFNRHADHLANTKDKYTAKDQSDDISGVSDEDLKKVHKDLKNRKYGFQIKTVPKAHTEYVSKLGSEIENRKKHK